MCEMPKEVQKEGCKKEIKKMKISMYESEEGRNKGFK